MSSDGGRTATGGQAAGPARPGPADVKRYRALLASERDAAVLYDRMAAAETGERREIFQELAAVERRHADHWASRLREAGAPVPERHRVSLRTRAMAALASRFSTGAVLPMVERAERTDAGRYDADPDAAAGMAADERGHARALARLREGARPQPTQMIARRERWHRGDRSGALRAAVFGVNDGLVSNTALVMGFAGSNSSRTAILFAGIAGLLAGAFSMAAGEYISMSSQREMYEREIAVEATELEENPEEEHEELVLLYRAKGLSKVDATRLADTIMENRETALDTLTREELGLDPSQLGSPWSAAVSSLIAFAVGAFVVVVPYLFGGGRLTFWVAVGLAALALFSVGVGLGLLNGRDALRSGLRQILVGGVAAGVTFLIGHLIGVSVS